MTRPTFVILLLLSTILHPLSTPLARAQLVADGTTATLANVTTNITGTLTVGTNGSLTRLTLADNALLINSLQGVIGQNGTARSNEVRLISPTARWQPGGTLYVGSNGPFNRLVISNGAQVIGTFPGTTGIIGQTTNSDGNLALVTGAGSVWSNAGPLTVGSFGDNNQLVVSNGARVHTENLCTVGLAISSQNNRVTVSGAGSLWSAGAIHFGLNGVGNRLLVRDGGGVLDTDGFVGSGAGGFNFVDLTGAGTFWTNTGEFHFGDSSQISEMTVSNGAVVFAARLGSIGRASSANVNTVTVTDPGSMWVNAGELFVGRDGSRNQLLVNNGGTVTATNLFIGVQPTATNNRVVVNGGTLRVTNAAGTSVLDIRRGTNQLVSGLVEADRLLVTNGTSRFEMLRGTLVTRGATLTTLNNGSGLDVGQSGGGLAFWDVRPGSNHFVANSLYIGNGSTSNQLLVSSGARLTNSTVGYVGSGIGADRNSATVTGSGSRWDVGNELRVGERGAFNRLTVAGSGRVASAAGRLGMIGTSGSNNLAVVTGAGSIWSNTFNLFVGENAPGNQLQVDGGGLVVSDSGTLGLFATSSGNTATVTDSGSEWRVATTLEVGDNGSFNQAVVSGGATVRDQNLHLGVTAFSSNNTVVVTGNQSLWTNQQNVIVGFNGPGNQLQIGGGGLVASGSARIGSAASATGNIATVADAGSEWRIGFGLLLGSSGSANRLVVSGGGRVTDDSVTMGELLNSSNNAAVVTGAGSRWNTAGQIRIGSFGNRCELVVSNGATVTAGSSLLGGNSVLNQAVVTGSGSVWSNATDLTVGDSAHSNRIFVLDGGVLASGSSAIGRFSGSSNSVVVSGPGSVWTNQANLIVGGAAGQRNRLLVSNGGKVSLGGSGTIGAESGAANNSVSVAGAGSSLTMGGDFLIGSNAPFNSLVVSNGGFVRSADALVGLQPTASNNVAVVTGAGSVWSNDIVTIGREGRANQLVVTNGGSVVSTVGQVGHFLGGDNNLALVTGSGSVWKLADRFIVGLQGNLNHLVVSNGGRVLSHSGDIIGFLSHSNQVIVTGAGSLVTNSEFRVGISGRENRLTISDNAIVNSARVTLGETEPSTNNRIVVAGGTLRATAADGSGFLDVRRGTNLLNSGLVDVDKLVLTNKGTIPLSGVFENGSAILISPDATAAPYPLTMAVAGLAGAVTKVTATLSNLTHFAPEGLRILLVGPGGQNVMLMSGAGGSDSLNNVKLTFDDGASGLVPNNNTIPSGTYRPTHYATATIMPGPAPGSPYSTNLSVFNGNSPNGTWSLFIYNAFSGAGSLLGWSVKIETDAPFLDSGTFEFNGGKLITRGAVISNSLPFVVGGPGGVPAVWEARAGLSDNFVARELLVGNNSSFNQLVIPSGVVVANTNVIVGASSVSSNNLLHVTGGTLHVLNPGTRLDVRGGTNRLDAGLVDVRSLVVTDPRGQFELNGGTLGTLSTTIANGRVFTVGGGANLATLQLLGGGHHSFADNLTVATNGSLIGEGTVNGTVSILPGGRLIPGAPLGTIVVFGSVILQGTVNLQIDKSGGIRANDGVVSDGAIFYSGTLNITDIGTDLLTAGDRFFLFDATPYIGAFTTLNLPQLSAGLAWKNNLSVDGSIEVVVATQSQPKFSSVVRSGANLILSGTNGTPNTPYAVLTATNVTTPAANWLSLVTNQFGASGQFSFTNGINPNEPQRYFRLRSP